MRDSPVIVSHRERSEALLVNGTNPETIAAPTPGSASTPVDASPRLLRRIALWLVPFAAAGTALALLYPDADQQDGGVHFLQARWSLEHPILFVGVWARPLFVLLYALPAQLGYPVAKLFTVAICLATAWHTARLAAEYGLARAELAVPFLMLQPVVLAICSETMTEPLFALVLVVALRLHRAGRMGASMWVAGLLPLVRPEGFFLAVLWGAFILFDPRAGRSVVTRALGTMRLAGGLAAWSLVGYVLSGDPLHVLHDWPWAADFSYGTGPLWHYWTARGDLLAGPLLQLLFAVGVGALVVRRRGALPMATVALVLVLHSVMYHYGLMGSAGYTRYLVCVAGPIALAVLEGWNVVADRSVRLPSLVRPAAAVVVVGWAVFHCVRFQDGGTSGRDARAVTEMYEWFQAHPRPVTKLVYSQAYMSILFGRDAWEYPLSAKAEESVALLRAAPAGTLVFWDRDAGPSFHAIGPAEIAGAGYELIRRKTYDLAPMLPVLHHSESALHRRTELYLYYKP